MSMSRLSSLQQFTRLCALGAGLLIGGDTLAAVENSCERIVATGNPDYPPLVWAPEGEKALTGVAIEMLQLALKDSGSASKYWTWGPEPRRWRRSRQGRLT